MMYKAVLIAASAAFASAQYSINSTSGAITCQGNINGAFCAGGSLSTNIIIRCNNGVGQPGNCNDNLDGEPPFGLSYAPCYESSPTAGDAACSKNCIVYEGSGSGAQNGTLTLSGCTPVPTTTVSTSTSSTTASTTITSTVTSTTSSTTTSSVPTTVVSSSGISNGTVTSGPTGSSATKTPSGPTSSSLPFTGGASANSAGLTLAGLGLVVAYFL